MGKRQCAGAAAFFLRAALLLQLGCVESQWSLDQFAQDFCTLLAEHAGTHCNCVDTLMIPGQGNNMCGYGSPLPPGPMGMTVRSSVFTGFAGASPTSNVLILNTEECDNRNSQHNATLTCTATNTHSITGEITVTQSVSLDREIFLGFTLLGFINPSVKVDVTLTGQTSISQGNTVTSSNACGPGGVGQPPGTCSIYTERYLSYELDGVVLTYDSVIGGGVWMSFADAIPVEAMLGQPGDLGPHFFWYIPIDQIVVSGQLNGAFSNQLPNANFFDNPKSGQPVTFHGSGILQGQFVDTSTTCSTSSCA